MMRDHSPFNVRIHVRNEDFGTTNYVLRGLYSVIYIHIFILSLWCGLINREIIMYFILCV